MGGGRERRAAARRWRGSPGLAPLALPSYILVVLMGFYLIGPLINLIPLGSISSWAFKPYCDDRLLGISPTCKSAARQGRGE